MATDRPALDSEGLLRSLVEHGVEFVVIGGTAGVGHGSPTATYDVDITPATDRQNLQRLARALAALSAQLRVPGLEEPVALRWVAEVFDSFTTVATRTRLGDLDIVLRPDGLPTEAFLWLRSRAHLLDLGDLQVPVASVEDVVASKRAAARRTGLRRYDDSADELERIASDDT